MARPPRIEYDGAWYHVINRGARRWKVFHDVRDRRYFFELLGEIRDLWNVEVHAYSLMDNHYHLLIHTPNSNLSKSMRHLGAQYTIYYNKKYQNDGALFRGRFKSILVEGGRYLLPLVRYIHLNPVKAGLCRKAAAHPWTSHKAYMDERKRPEWLVVSEVLRQFCKTYTKSKRRLEEFVHTDESPDLIKAIEGKKRVSLLGSGGFKEWVRDNFLDEVSKEKVIPTMRSNRRQRIPPQKIRHYVAQAYRLKEAEVLKQKGRERNEARSMYIYLLRRINGTTHSEIARHLQSKTTVAISQNLRRFSQERKKNKLLNEKVEVYTQNLLSHVQS